MRTQRGTSHSPLPCTARSPAQRLNALTQLLTQLYLPAAPLLAQSGGTLDMEAITRTYSELMNEPRLMDWIKFVGAPMPDEAGPGDEMPGPSNTTRNYVRRSVPSGGSAQSRSQSQQAEWLSQAGNSGQSGALRQPAA